MTPTVAPRLHAIFAREASTAVVIRRGPSRSVAVFGWQRATDTFRLGQWLRGRIYERRCDLSPNGEHFLYFAMNGKWKSEASGAWTAVSRAPYLKAVGLWPKGDCWNGGGLFLSNRQFWLNDGRFPHKTSLEAAGLRHRSEPPTDQHFGGECPGVYYVRLQRDGWTLVEITPDGRGGRITRFSKRVNDHWSLHKLAHETLHHPVGRGCYFDQHALVDERTGEVFEQPAWEWADVDGARLVWASDGKLSSGRLTRTGMTHEKLLFDFAPARFERVQAPY